MSKRQTYIIAEVGQAHEGSLGILHSYIDALAETGVDAVKFQVHIAEAESSIHEPFRIPFSYEDENRYDYWKRMSFSEIEWREIKSHCESLKVNFLASPFSIQAVDLLERLGATQYKVGSGEVNNLLMLERIAKTAKPIILSSGMSSYAELRSTVEFLKLYGNDLSILQCTTAYPTLADQLGLNVISELKERFPACKIGLSEHTARKASSIAAVALGAEIIEFHAVFDRRMFGPDASSSLTIDEISEVVQSIRFVEKALNNPVIKDDTSSFSSVKKIFEKSLAVSKDLDADHILRFEDLESKKPAKMGIDAQEYRSFLGRKLRHPKKRNEFLNVDDFAV